jgi:hypothetical protein
MSTEIIARVVKMPADPPTGKTAVLEFDAPM